MVIPAIRPMPYVTSMAIAPPSTTRMTARRLRAPPSTALTVPVRTSATSTATNATGTRKAAGGNKIATNGTSAPRVNATADDTAACDGLDRSLGVDVVGSEYSRAQPAEFANTVGTKFNLRGWASGL